MENIKKKKKKLNRDITFYVIGMLWPIGQFLIFYIGVNLQSVLMAFQSYDVLTQSVDWTFGFMSDAVVTMFTSDYMLMLWGSSLKVYVLSLCIGTPLGLFFSFAIYKKVPFHSGFRVFLFLPAILSAIVMVTIYQFFVEQGIPELMRKLFNVDIKGLIENPNTSFAAIMTYTIFMSFGTSVLMYSNAMSGISSEIVESAHLDGASGIREFWYITLPTIFPTISTFLITGIVGIFSNQMNLYSFYGGSAPPELQTYGYYFYMKTASATSRAEYSPLAAMGIVMSVIAIALTFTVRWAIEKFGPAED